LSFYKSTEAEAQNYYLKMGVELQMLFRREKEVQQVGLRTHAYHASNHGHPIRICDVITIYIGRS
jgi:hypothetical protein